MKKGKHTEAEIIKAVKETENRVSNEAVYRSHGIARGTLYNWRVKYGGMDDTLLILLLERKYQCPCQPNES